MGGDTSERKADPAEAPRHDPDPDDIPEPRRLRHLRWLVNALTITLMAGFLTIVIALVLRLTAEPPAPALPDRLRLPPGETARAVTLGQGWVAVVTVDAAGAERVRVLDAATGAPRASVPIAPAD